MTALHLAGFAAAASVGALVIRRFRPEFSAVIALFAGVALAMSALPQVGAVIDTMSSMLRKGGVASPAALSLLRITGVGLLSDFAAQSCRDAGENGIASRVEFVARVMILVIALPSMQSLMDVILSLSV